MSDKLPSEEVAEDYKSSLEDLVVNDRNQIGVLTVIAKENTEHGMAIARVLENHIRKAPPARKLPALYVLDSIVKNVGTPYTLYFQRNLYQTFMGAYTLVDSNVRKKLDEMLKTWKEPVPGSMDTVPVFPSQTTQAIEDALNKARSAALQRTQSAHPQMRATATPPTHWRNTPPPQYGQPNPGYQQPSRNGAAQYHPQYSTPQPQQYQFSQPQAQPQYSTQPVSAYSQSNTGFVDVGALRRDIETLVAAARTAFANNISDTAVQAKLKALLDLQSILETKALPDHQLRQIRDQVSQLAPMSQPVARPTPPPTLPIHVVAPTPPVPPQVPTPQPPIPSFLNSSNLADLLRVTASRNQPTPPPQALQPSTLPFNLPPAPNVNTPPVAYATPVQPPAENPLIAQLRAAGLLPATGTSSTNGVLPFSPPSGLSQPSLPHQSTSSTRQVSVKLTSASVKIPRPHLIASIYDDRPNRCTTCGRRFTEDAVGKEKKLRHLDWHFKTNTRLVEAAKRGQSRSWYVDEREWISSREYEDDSGPVEEANGTGTAAKAKKKEYFLPVPNDPALRNAPCPICQEKFESTWSEDVQEFIWRDAIKVGNRVYHASCYKEATKDKEGGATPLGAGRARTATPDNVLGKRKAEHDANDIITKIKLEAS